MSNELQIGWYDPGSHRFCYTDVKKNMSGHEAYTVPVYAHMDDDVSKLKERIKELEKLLKEIKKEPLAAMKISHTLKGGE